MKVVILCGGKGTRIREETEVKPKPMIEIGGRPILWHIMKRYSHYGFKDFIVCMGYKQDVIRDYFLNYHCMNSDVTVSLASNVRVVHSARSEDWNVTLVDTGLETKKGTRIKMIEPYLTGDKFMVTYGDGVSDINIADLLAYHKSQNVIATFTGVHPISRFATVEQDSSGKIVDWNEKQPLEGFINAGFFVLEKEILDYIQDDVELEEEPMKNLAAKSELAMYQHEGFWQCMDTYRDYLLLSELWNSKRAPWQI
jgi:glucose-1-phosphate cytidylyltransferase